MFSSSTSVSAHIKTGRLRAIARPEVKERFFNSGADTVGTPPERLSATVSAEIVRLGKVVKEAGIRLIE